MRVSVESLGAEYLLWRVYDHRLGTLRDDVVWADAATAQLGVCHCGLGFGAGAVGLLCGGSNVEQRERVLIVRALRWIAVDVPGVQQENEASQTKKLVLPASAR